MRLQLAPSFVHQTIQKTLVFVLLITPIGCTHQAICDAIEKRDYERLHQLLARDIDPNGQCWNSHWNTPLIMAVQLNDDEVVYRLLHLGAKVDAPNRYEQTALMYASGRVWYRSGRPDRDKVLALIDYGADVNAQSRDGKTALMYAAGSGETEIVRTLLKYGADVHLADYFGNTALHKGAAGFYYKRGNETEIVELLLAAGADVNAKDQIGRTPLMMAMYLYSENEIRAIKILLDAGADPNARDHKDRSVLAIARERIKEPYLPIVEQLLLDAGAQTPNPHPN